MNPVALFSFRSVSAIGSKGMRTPGVRLQMHWIRTVCRTSGCCWRDACFLSPVPVFRGLCFPARHPPLRPHTVCDTCRLSPYRAMAAATDRMDLLPLPLSLLGTGVHTLLPHSSALQLQQVCSSSRLRVHMCHTSFQCSMQQGKMFLFMGTVMALTQGGLVRRIAPGKELFYALIVRHDCN